MRKVGKEGSEQKPRAALMGKVTDMAWARGQGR